MRIDWLSVTKKTRCITFGEPTSTWILILFVVENIGKFFNGSLVLISNDRKFLETVTNRTLN